MKNRNIYLLSILLTFGIFSSANAQKKRKNIKNTPIEDTIHIVGHAHMDMNWLWTYSETMKMCNDNLRQVVAFMEEFPDFTFIQSMGSIYKFIKCNHFKSPCIIL